MNSLMEKSGGNSNAENRSESIPDSLSIASLADKLAGSPLGT